MALKVSSPEKTFKGIVAEMTATGERPVAKARIILWPLGSSNNNTNADDQGRFEIMRLPHWSLAEMRAAFDFNLDEYLYFGGYPGAAPLVTEPTRWRRYILDSLVETSIARDVLLLTRVDKPALLRRLFELGCRYSGQVLSYNKMLGQLHDAGN